MSQRNLKYKNNNSQPGKCDNLKLLKFEKSWKVVDVFNSIIFLTVQI